MFRFGVFRLMSLLNIFFAYRKTTVEDRKPFHIYTLRYVKEITNNYLKENDAVYSETTFERNS